MKIVHVEDFFHPDAGYQINILPKYMAKDGHDVTIVTSEIDKAPESLKSFFGKDKISERDNMYTKITGVKIIRLKIKGFVSGRAIFENKIFNVVKTLKPDVLYIHGNDTLTAMQFLMRAKKMEFPIVMDSHMLEMASINKFNKFFRNFYKKFFTPIILKNNIPVIRTQNDSYVEKHLGIPLNQAPWISVGSDTLLFNENQIIRNKFRAKYNINEDDFVVVYTGKLDVAKGADLLAEAFLEKFNSRRNIILLVVGNVAGEYGDYILEKFKQSDNRILHFPTQKYIDLPAFYQSSDLSVFPKQCSLSFYDAQACGLPVISENNNINIDRLKFSNGFNFEANDTEDFRQKIIHCVNMDQLEYQDMRKNSLKFIKENYDYEAISKKYMEVINKWAIYP